MNDNEDTMGLWAGRVVLGLLALSSLACILSGGFFYVWIVAEYLEDGGPWTGLQMIAWLIGLVAAGVVALGFVIGGIALRLFPSPQAPLASLGLAIVAVGFVIVTYLVFSDTGHGSDSIEVVVLQGLCLVYLPLVPLPPFLHWLRARPDTAAPRPPRTTP